MKAVLFILLACFLLISQPVVAKVDYLSLLPSIHLFVPSGCTAFSINQKKGYWVSAAHCVLLAESGETMSILNRIVRVKARSYLHDMVVLESAAKAPALKLESRAPKIGDRVVLAGYAWGQQPLLFLWGRIMYPTLPIGFELAPGVMWLNASYVDGDSGPGNSGSPVLSEDRLQVVGVHLGEVPTDPTYSVMVPWEEVREFAGSYWGS